MTRPRAVDPTADVGLLALAVAGGVTSRIRDRLEAAGFDDVRDSHGYVVQGLLARRHDGRPRWLRVWA